MKDSFVVRLAECYILLSILPFMAIFSQNAASGDFFENIEIENPKPKVKAIFSFGGGLSFLTSKGAAIKDFESKTSFQFSALTLLGKFTGIRLDFGFSNWVREDFVSESSDSLTLSSSRDSYGAQTKDGYQIKADFVVGSFDTRDNFLLFLSAGLGVNFLAEGGYLHKQTVYEFHNSFPYRHDTSYYINAGKSSGALLSLGTAFGYRFTKQLGVYTDVQFSIASYSGLSFYGKETESYLPIRFGITYTIY